MAKFKKGDRVRYLGGICESSGLAIGSVCVIDDSEYPYFHAEDGSYNVWGLENHFELIEDKPMKYTVGQVLERDNRNYTREIVANFEDKALITIDSSNHEGNTYSVKELENDGWHLKTTPENTEMTVKEIEDKLGVKNLKVVKE